MAEKVVVKGLADLDAMIAEKLMGWTLAKGRNFYDRRVGATVTNKRGTLSGVALTEVPCYSSKIADARLVVERMREEGWKVVIVLDGRTSAITMYPPDGKGGAFYSESSDTLPVNACLAALRAKGVEVELQLEGGGDG